MSPSNEYFYIFNEIPFPLFTMLKKLRQLPEINFLSIYLVSFGKMKLKLRLSRQGFSLKYNTNFSFKKQPYCQQSVKKTAEHNENTFLSLSNNCLVFTTRNFLSQTGRRLLYCISHLLHPFEFTHILGKLTGENFEKTRVKRLDDNASD